MTSMLNAIDRDDVMEVESLINAGVDVDAVDISGDTALIRAAMKGRKYIFYMLLAAGANVNIVNKHGDTALAWAKNNNNNDIATALRVVGAR